MEDIIKIAQIIVPIIAGIALGAVFRKKKILNTKSTSAIKDIIMDYLMPLNLGFSMAMVELSFSVLLMPVVGFVMNVMCFLLSFLMKKLFREKNYYFPYLLTTYENGLLGINLFAMIFPMLNNALLASMDLGFCIFFFFIYLPMMKGTLRGGEGFFSKIKKVLSSRILLAILAGLFLNVIGVWGFVMNSFMGSIITATVDFLTAIIVPLALFLVGYEISFDRKTIALVLKTSFARIITTAIVCAVTLFGLNVLGILDKDMTYALVFVSSLPAPLMLNVFADDENEAGYINAQVSTYIVVTIITIAVLLLLL